MKWIIIVALLLFSLFSSSLTMASGTLLSIPSEADAEFHNLKVVDSMGRSRVHTAVSDFRFSAHNICNKNFDAKGSPIELCLDITGRGINGANMISASGIFSTYILDQQTSKIADLSKGPWSDTNLLYASNKKMSFMATTSSGNVFIKLVEGASETSGQVCAYGPLVGIERSEDAVCASNSVVVIGNIDATKEINSSIESFKFLAKSICNDKLPTGLCIDISGGRGTESETIAASGIFVTYIHLPNHGELSTGAWSVTDFFTATEREMSFKAHASAGNIFIKLVEGETENSGQICAYGPLIGISDHDDAICIQKAFVVIGTAESKS